MLGNQGMSQPASELAEKTQQVSGLVVFPIPSGFVPPEGVQPGQSFEAVCRVQYKDGQMILEAIEGHEVRSAPQKSPEQNSVSFENAVERGLSANEGMA